MSKVAVVGLGKIGLPLAALYASKGHDVTGCDISEDVVQAVNSGRSHVVGEAGLEEAVRRESDAGRLRATTDTPGAVAESDVVVVMVRVGLDAAEHADYHYLDLAASNIGHGLKPGTLVILESTVPVGATRNRFGRRLAGASGLSYSSFSPSPSTGRGPAPPPSSSSPTARSASRPARYSGTSRPTRSSSEASIPRPAKQRRRSTAAFLTRM